MQLGNLKVYAVAGMVGLAATACGDAATSGTVGVVVDPEGNPVADTQVKIAFYSKPLDKEGDKRQKPGYAQPIQQLMAKDTDAKGTFHISPVANGVGVLTVDHPPYAMKIMTVKLPDPDLRVKLENNGATMHGTVKNASTGLPVEGARVTAMPAMSVELELEPGRISSYSPIGHILRAETDAAGKYTIDRLPAGTSVTLDAAADNLFGASERPFQENQVVLKPGEEGTAPDLLVYPGHTLTGRVIDKETGLPVTGAQVNIGYGTGGVHTIYSVASGKTMQPAISDNDGRYSLSPLKPWKNPATEGDDNISFMPVTITAPGYRQTRFNPTAPRQFDPSALTINHDFELMPIKR